MPCLFSIFSIAGWGELIGQVDVFDSSWVRRFWGLTWVLGAEKAGRLMAMTMGKAIVLWLGTDAD